MSVSPFTVISRPTRPWRESAAAMRSRRRMRSSCPRSRSRAATRRPCSTAWTDTRVLRAALSCAKRRGNNASRRARKEAVRIAGDTSLPRSSPPPAVSSADAEAGIRGAPVRTGTFWLGNLSFEPGVPGRALLTSPTAVPIGFEVVRLSKLSFHRCLVFRNVGRSKATERRQFPWP